MTAAKHRILFAVILVAAAALLVPQLQFSNRGGVRSPFDGDPQRIITIAPNASEVIAALGESDRLVGVSEFCRIEGKEDFVNVGGLTNPNIEAITLLKPDLVILRGKMKELEQICEASGIAVHHDGTERFDDIFESVAQLGRILDQESRAADLIQSAKQEIETIQARLPDRKVRVLFTTNRDPASLGQVMTVDRNSFVHDILELAGAENIFGDSNLGYPTVSAETIVSRNPEVIIEVMPQLDHMPESLRMQVIDQWSSLGEMDAVKHGRIEILTDNALLIPSLEVTESVLRLARLLHPGAFP